MNTPRRERPGKGSLAGSAAVHLGILALAWTTQAATPAPQRYLVYEIDLVSAAAAAEGPVTPPREEVVVETPEPEPEETPPPPDAETRPEPTPTEPERAEPEPARDPRPEPSTGGEDLRVRMEGLRRDYPAYYENIIRQIHRCFRWRGEPKSATVRFMIHRDGTVSDLRVIRGSGSFTFDLEAMGAVECAGQGRLGPLPSDFPWDQLPIEFRFDPSRRQDASLDPMS